MNFRELQQSPEKFRAALKIDTDDGCKPLTEVIDDFQRIDFEALDNGLRRAVGQSVESGFSRAWIERPRGHSKTSDLAIMVSWLLFASRKPLSGLAAAADRDQAGLLKDGISRLVFANPWLSDFIEVQKNSVVNPHTDSNLQIITSDAPSSYGALPDFIICDELTHWQKRDLWDSLLSSSAKRKHCLLVVITNAGFIDDWQWDTREAIRKTDNWYFSRLDGPVASWLTPEALAEQQALLPPAAFDRLWRNQWSSGGGDALDTEQIEYAFRGNLLPLSAAIPDFEFVGGLDLGVSRDASAVCVLGIRRTHHDHGSLRLASTRIWRPTKRKKVDLRDVERTLFELHQKFKFKQLNFDPWQAQHMASRLQAGGMGKLVTASDRRTKLPMVEVAPTGKNLQRMATSVIEAFNDRRIQLYEEPDLRRDIEKFRVVEKSYGFRIESPRDATGHGDLGTAFQLALLAAVERAAKRKITLTAFGASVTLSDFEQDLKQFEREKERFDFEQSQPVDYDEPLNFMIHRHT